MGEGARARLNEEAGEQGAGEHGCAVRDGAPDPRGVEALDDGGNASGRVVGEVRATRR